MKYQFDNLVNSNTEQLQKLHQIIQETLDEEALITQNLLYPPAETLTQGQKISDKVARFGGSWAFIISFGIVLFVWILINVLLPEQKRFDPYPFILMNLILSTIAALQAPVIMMSQNRQEEKDRQNAENDYLVNLKAELEVRNLHRKMNLLMEEQIKTLMDIQAIQLKSLEDLAAQIQELKNKN